MKHQKIKWIFLLIALIPLTIFSQPKADSIPGNPKLPSSVEELEKLAKADKGVYVYSIEDYFTNPSKSNFKLSPNGKYLSFKRRETNGKVNVYIQDIATNKTTLAIEEKEQLIVEYLWGSNAVLLYVMDKGGDENYHLYSYNLKTKKDTDLTPFDGAKVQTLYKLIGSPNEIIVTINKRNKEIFEPYKINLETGKGEFVFENNDAKNSISSYKFSDKGVLRSYTKLKNGIEDVLYYRNIGEQEFHEITTTSWKDTFVILDFVSEQSDKAYVLSNIGTDKKEIVLYDLKKNEIIERLYRNEVYDLASISKSYKRNNELDYFEFDGEKPALVPISKYWKDLYKKLAKKFGANFFVPSSMTVNEDKYIIHVSSDVLAGQEYLYDVKQNSFKLLVDLKPNLNVEKMAHTTPIKFTTRDGYIIHGYLTMPLKKTKDKVPLIVNPHGGPYGERDSWGFDREAQIFADRGYATLKINYRGSGGYGKKLYLAGSKQIGRNMLNDLEDGVKYVIELGEIDKNKVAIYGASYGGLASLGSLIKSPDLYTCGVSYVGVSNFFTFVDSFPAYWKPFMKQFYEQWYDPEIPEEKEIMKASSPALNIDKLNKPVFVVQGANDPRVNINESDQIVSGLRSKGFNVPYMVKYDEGHGFDKEKNIIELYKVMMGFFAENFK
ncbi:alpha/beta hydrolase family protein [Flavobacterium poyangense]|uniref:alpha/beta hydrolase family protein n=1 Tax=Flavobacterium poyangense TaxID=2204302 RepID=UPI0014247318|nr:prolyl oligopeptidase family serine peptidase [Flavobacterium sp. JXAS1]